MTTFLIIYLTGSILSFIICEITNINDGSGTDIVPILFWPLLLLIGIVWIVYISIQAIFTK